VIRDCEDDPALVECFHQEIAPCCIESACVLRKALVGTLDAFLAQLDGYTLAAPDPAKKTPPDCSHANARSHRRGQGQGWCNYRSSPQIASFLID